MSVMSVVVTKLAGDSIDDLGGHLRCSTCGRKESHVGASARYLRAGWPKCCGYQMELITAKQIAEGYEVR